MVLTSFFCILSAACLSSPSPTAAPVSTPALDSQAAQIVMLAATRDAQATLDAQSTARVTATEGALSAKKTATQAAAIHIQQTQAAQTQQTIQSATAAFAAQATQQAQPMLDAVAALQQQGVIRSTGGTYYRLNDYEQSWAQIDHYQWISTGHAPDNFIVRADIAWNSASTIANWVSSGCGFVFRENGKENHYLAFFGLDGYVYMMRVVQGVPTYMGEGYYGKVDVPAGKASILLAVDQEWINVYVNGLRAFRRQDFGLTSGNLAYTLVSGTNKDFGTSCHFTNVELWEVQ